MMGQSLVKTALLLASLWAPAAFAAEDLPPFLHDPLIEGPQPVQPVVPEENSSPRSLPQHPVRRAVTKQSLVDVNLRQAIWKTFMDRALGYIQDGDFRQAHKLVDMARKEAVVIGEREPNLAATEKIAGDIYWAQKNSDAAERAYLRSIYLFEKVDEADKNEYAAALSSYANLLKVADRIRESSRFEAQAQTLRNSSTSAAAKDSSL